MFSSALPLSRAFATDHRDKFIGLSQELRFHANRSFDDYLSGNKRLLHSADLMDRLDAAVGIDAERRQARLEALFAETTGHDFDFASLREASALERRQALGQYAETFAVFEDLREGAKGKRRHAKELVAIPLEPPSVRRPRPHFVAYRPSLAPPEPPDGLPRVPLCADRLTPIPINHLRVARCMLNGREERFDVLAHLDAMTVQEAVNLVNPSQLWPGRIRQALIYDGQIINAKRDLSLRAAGIAHQTELKVTVLF